MCGSPLKPFLDIKMNAIDGAIVVSVIDPLLAGNQLSAYAEVILLFLAVDRGGKEAGVSGDAD